MQEQESKPMVTLSKERYEELLESEKFLRALEFTGVDSWEGYDIAREGMDN